MALKDSQQVRREVNDHDRIVEHESHLYRANKIVNPEPQHLAPQRLNPHFSCTSKIFLEYQTPNNALASLRPLETDALRLHSRSVSFLLPILLVLSSLRRHLSSLSFPPCALPRPNQVAIKFMGEGYKDSPREILRKTLARATSAQDAGGSGGATGKKAQGVRWLSVAVERSADPRYQHAASTVPPSSSPSSPFSASFSPLFLSPPSTLPPLCSPLHPLPAASCCLSRRGGPDGEGGRCIGWCGPPQGGREGRRERREKKGGGGSDTACCRRGWEEREEGRRRRERQSGCRL